MKSTRGADIPSAHGNKRAPASPSQLAETAIWSVIRLAQQEYGVRVTASATLRALIDHASERGDYLGEIARLHAAVDELRKLCLIHGDLHAAGTPPA